MTYFVSYLQVSGELIGVSNIAPPILDNVYVAQYNELPNLISMMWDISTLSFITNPFSGGLSKLEFLTRFTTPERIAIRNSTDPIVGDFMALLNMAESISLTDMNTQNGVGYLVYIGLLEKHRIREILV